MAMGHLYKAYCDESCTTSRFMVFGGVVGPAGWIASLDSTVSAWRTANNMTSEMKWVKVTEQKQEKYRSFVDIFFDAAQQRRIKFSSVVFDCHKMKYKDFHDGDKEIAFYKFMYTFLLHKFCCYATAEDDRLLIFLDQRVTTYKLADLHRILNSGYRKKNNNNWSPVKTVEAVCSKASNLMQITDVLMGAVGYHNNQMHLRPEARKAKNELAAYIAKRSGLASLRSDVSGRSFSIWQFRLR